MFDHQKIAEEIAKFSNDSDTLGDAYEYLIGQFAAGSGKKAGEFYTPQQVSTILSKIVTLDSQDPTTDPKKRIDKVLDFACGSGSLLLNVRHQMNRDGRRGIGKIYGQEKNITTYNLARMNMLLHGVKDSEFEIFHGDTLLNDWDILNEMNPAKKIEFDAIVANPPFSYRWEPKEDLANDFRFRNYGVARNRPPTSPFIAWISFPTGRRYDGDYSASRRIISRGRGKNIRTKLLKDGNLDAVIGLPANLFFSTGIPVCILVLKKCKNQMTYCLSMPAKDIRKTSGKTDYAKAKTASRTIFKNSRHLPIPPRGTTLFQAGFVGANRTGGFQSEYYPLCQYGPRGRADRPAKVNDELKEIARRSKEALDRHNEFLKELGLPTIAD